MWRKDGTKLTGYYCTWNGREVELSGQGVDDGKLRLIQDGGDSPGPEWRKLVFPNRFARTPVHYSLKVPVLDVSNMHKVEVTGVMERVKVRIVAEDETGRLAIETDGHTHPSCRDDLAQKYDLEFYDDRRAWAFGWVPAEDVHDVTVERRDITKD